MTHINVAGRRACRPSIFAVAGDVPPEHWRDVGCFACVNATRGARMGVPRRTRRRDVPLLERYEPEPNTGCWLWIGPLDRDGYGRVRAPYQLAHRAFFALLVAPLTPGLFVCHRCSVRWCVNPVHLYEGDAQSNARDAVQFARQYRLPHSYSASYERASLDARTRRAVRPQRHASDRPPAYKEGL